MNLRILWAALGLCFAGAASAQTIEQPHQVQFAEGRGILRNDHAQEAHFAFAVKKVDDQQAVGRFEFATSVPDHGRVSIVTEHINQLAVDHNHATFGGPAVLRTVDHDGNVHEIEGTLRVHVVDNAVVFNGHERLHVDLLELHFEAAHANLTFDFGGRAHPDSIRVGVRTGD